MKTNLKVQIETAKAKLRKEGRKCTGLRVLWQMGGYDTIPAGSRMMKIAIENLSKQNSEAFEVFTNPNNEVALRQVAWTAHFYLV